MSELTKEERIKRLSREWIISPGGNWIVQIMIHLFRYLRFHHIASSNKVLTVAWVDDNSLSL